MQQPGRHELTCTRPAFPYFEQQDDDSSQMREVSCQSEDVHGRGESSEKQLRNQQRWGSWFRRMSSFPLEFGVTASPPQLRQTELRVWTGLKIWRECRSTWKGAGQATNTDYDWSKLGLTAQYHPPTPTLYPQGVKIGLWRNVHVEPVETLRI